MLQGQWNGPTELQCHSGSLSRRVDLCLLPAPSGPPWQDSQLDLPPAGPYVLPALQGLQSERGRARKDEKANFFLSTAPTLRAKEWHHPSPCALQPQVETLNTGWSSAESSWNSFLRLEATHSPCCPTPPPCWCRL